MDLRPVLPGLPPEVRSALERFRFRVRFLRALRGFGITLALAAALFGVSLLLDRQFILPAGLRILITSAAAAGAAVCGYLTVLLPVLRPFSRRRAALGLEAAVPELEERLISTFDLAECGAPAGTSAQLAAMLARSTAESLSAVEVNRLVDPRAARWALLASAGALLLLVGFASLDPRGFGLLARRFLQPASDLPRPARVGLEVLPGNAIAGEGDDVGVTIRITRGRPTSVELLWRVPGGDWRSGALEPEPAQPSGGGVPVHRHLFRRLRQTIEYQAVAGDAASPVHRLTVRERPRPESFSIEYRYPAYTRRPPRTVASSRGELSALTGSTAAVAVSVVGPLQTARIERDGEPPAPLAVETGPEGRATVRAEIEIRRSGSYRLHLADADGISNRGGESYSIRAEEDRPPRARILSPATVEVTVEEAVRLEIRYEAQDDFGIEELALAAGPTEAERRFFPIPLGAGADSPAGSPRPIASGAFVWDLAPLGLRPGESVPFRLLAKDGRGQSGASAEMLLRVAFLPDPPEGAGFAVVLREIERGLDRAAGAWDAALSRLWFGGPAAGTLSLDAAFAERLGQAREELLKESVRRERLVERTAEAGRAIPIPSVNRKALADLAAGLRRFGEESAKLLAAELAAAEDEVRSGLRAAAAARPAPAAAPEAQHLSTASIVKAHAEAAARLHRLRESFQALHRVERIEDALERVRALLLSEEAMLERAREAASAGPGSKPPPPETLRIQRALRVEATGLAATLELLARGPGGLDEPVASLSRAFMETAIPALESAQKAIEGAESAVEPLERAAGAFRDAAAELERELLQADAEAARARRELDPPSDLPESLAALAASEGGAAEAIERKGLDGARQAAAGDLARRGGVARLRATVIAESERIEKTQPLDFESAGDLALLRDLTRDLLDGPLAEAARRTADRAGVGPAGGPGAGPEGGAAARPNSPDEALQALAGERRRVAEVLDGLAHAAAGILPGAALGSLARRLDAVSEAAEGAAWRLRAIARGQPRALRFHAAVLRELELTLDDARIALDGASKEAPACSEAAAGAARALQSCREAALFCRGDDPAAARSSASAAARHAEAAARRADEGRSQLAGLAKARTWMQRQAGSLAERIERIAQSERAHAATVARLAAQLEPSAGQKEGSVARIQPETIVALAIDQENLREEAERLSGAAWREAALLRASSKAAVLAIARAFDAVAARIVEASRGGMRHAARSLDGAARAVDAAGQRSRLASAAAEEEKAAAALLAVAQAVRDIEAARAVDAAVGDLEKLLAHSDAAADTPEGRRKLIEEAQGLLDGVRTARGVLQTRLAPSVLRAEMFERLDEAAARFQDAIENVRAGSLPRAVELLAEGRARLEAAIGLVRRIRGEAVVAKPPPGPPTVNRKSVRALDRDLAATYEELRKLQELRERQAKVAWEIEELLREGRSERFDEKLKKLAELELALSEELEARFLTSAQLVDLVASLLGAVREARRIGAAEREIGGELSKAEEKAEEKASDKPHEMKGEEASGAAKDLAGRQAELLAGAEALASTVKKAGATLTINLPAVLKPLWSAESRAAPALAAMRAARDGLAGERPASAAKPLDRAAGELEALADLLGIARRRALEEIAHREEEGGEGTDAGELGGAEAGEAMREAARQLAEGNLEAARSLQGSAARGLLSAAEILRMRIDGMQAPSGGLASPGGFEGGLLAGGGWDLALRGDQAEEGPAAEEKPAGADAWAELSENFPEAYREMARIYLRALAEGK